MFYSFPRYLRSEPVKKLCVLVARPIRLLAAFRFLYKVAFFYCCTAERSRRAATHTGYSSDGSKVCAVLDDVDADGIHLGLATFCPSAPQRQGEALQPRCVLPVTIFNPGEGEHALLAAAIRKRSFGSGLLLLCREFVLKERARANIADLRKIVRRLDACALLDGEIPINPHTRVILYGPFLMWHLGCRFAGGWLVLLKS